MTNERNEQLFRRLIDVGFTNGDTAVVDEIVRADAFEHQRGSKPGAEGTKDTIRTLHSWFSDFTLTVEDLVAQGDVVWARNRARGVNTGSVMGFPPTGKSFAIDVFDVCRFENGKMVEHWGVPDQLGLLAQLGHLARPQSPR